MLEAVALAILVAGTAFWIDTLRAREAALVAGRAACARYDLILLDDTVAVTKLSLARNEEGRLRVARLYGFEFSDTGNNRRRGSILLLGSRAEDISFEPYETEANAIAMEAPARASHLTRVKWTKSAMTPWLEGTVVAQTRWTERLLSLRIETPADAPAIAFEAGQFGKLALDVGGERIARPYSFVNPPGASPLEFYYAIVDQGPLSPRLATLAAGEKVFLAPSAAGFLVLSEVPDAATLWLVATGTGVGPFLSILRTETPWNRYKRVVLVYAARHASELAYAGMIEAIAKARGSAFGVVTVSSRDADAQLRGRIPALIEDGSLEARAGSAITAADSQVMLCGNPDMVRDTIAALAPRGMKKHRRRNPGQITVENYW